jgi:transposase
MAGKTKNYTDDFKKQIVALKQNGKSTSEIAREYQIAKSTIVKWVNNYSKQRKVQYQRNV